jgi:hypothetical protein
MLKLEWSGKEGPKPLLPIIAHLISLSLVKKGKCNSKRAGKGFLKIVVRQRKGTFFGKEVCKCAKSNAKRKDRKRVVYVS